MSNEMLPFNITLLNLTPENLHGLKPVRSLDIFDGATRNFNDDGLFSISIFGKVGDERRSRRFSYIDIKVSIFHPVIYRALIDLKRFYGEILSGSSYATWNNITHDFEKSTPLLGQTGFEFFRKHWKNIVFDEKGGDTRIFNIQKYKEHALINKIVVLPAGMRDIEIDSNNKISKNEINDFYYKLLAYSNTINQVTLETSPEALDKISLSLQQNFIQVYELMEDMLQGKKRLVYGKWASRRIFNGTRNVITSMPVTVKMLHAKGNPGFNDTIIGLYQFIKACLPVAIHNLRNDFLSKIFLGPNAPVVLVNKKTLKKETLSINSAYYDKWMSLEGLEKVITSFSEVSLRHTPLEIDGKYMGLIYKGPDNTYRLMQDIDELPKTRSKSDVYPLTFCELIYLAVYKTAGDYPVFVTRYPITGMRSIYPSMVYLKPTVLVEERRELDENWEPKDDSCVSYCFPVTNASFVESMSPHASRLVGLSADFKEC
jgi:hypothetical protein